MHEIRIIRDTIKRADLAAIAQQMGWLYVKAVVDVERELMAVGADMHVDEERALLLDGSKQENLWGINLYPDAHGPDGLEFDSMINVKPWQGNRSRGVEDENIRTRTHAVVKRLVIDL